jgi:hypothetical protein
MSTTSTRPAARSAGGSSRHGLGAPKVTVTSARTWAAGVSPVSGSTPLGRSTATTSGPGPSARSASRVATRVAAGSRNPGDPPRPTSPSSTRSARRRSSPATRGASSVPTRRPPAARRAARPSAWTAGPSRTACTLTPRPASRAPAQSASPPLLPAPTSRTARLPSTRPLRRSSRRHTAASPAAARCIRAPGGVRASRSSSTARIAATGQACRRSLTFPPSALFALPAAMRRSSSLVTGAVMLVRRPSSSRLRADRSCAGAP